MAVVDGPPSKERAWLWYQSQAQPSGGGKRDVLSGLMTLPTNVFGDFAISSPGRLVAFGGTAEESRSTCSSMCLFLAITKAHKS